MIIYLTIIDVINLITAYHECRRYFKSDMHAAPRDRYHAVQWTSSHVVKRLGGLELNYIRNA